MKRLLALLDQDGAAGGVATARVPLPMLVRGDELITETGRFGDAIRCARSQFGALLVLLMVLLMLLLLVLLMVLLVVLLMVLLMLLLMVLLMVLLMLLVLVLLMLLLMLLLMVLLMVLLLVLLMLLPNGVTVAGCVRRSRQSSTVMLAGTRVVLGSRLAQGLWLGC